MSVTTPSFAHPATVAPASSKPAARPVPLSARLWDLVAALLLVAGATLFGTARYALTMIGSGGAAAPLGEGETWVQRADALVAQSQLGLTLAVAGIVVALCAATMHWRRGRGVIG